MLQECADANVAVDEQQVSTFIYRPSPDFKHTPGQRRLFPYIPKASAGGLTGVAAVTLATDRRGEILAKRLLFATNPAVGALVLDEVERWMEVRDAGHANGFLDVLFFRFKDGSLQMMLIYDFSAADPKAISSRLAAEGGPPGAAARRGLTGR